MAIDDTAFSAMLRDHATVAARHGHADHQETAVPRLTIWRATAPADPFPALFDPQFYLLLQGAKRMTIGGETLDVCVGTCGVGSVGLPFVSQVMKASVAEPYLGIGLKLTQGTIADLLSGSGDRAEEPAGAISFGMATGDILEPFGRLLRLLDTPGDIPVLAAAYERELCYRLLQSELGSRLRQLGRQTARFAQIRAAANWIAENADQPMDVAWLAAHVGMSVTSFHRHFRAVTSHTPLAYRQHIRLLDARRRLTGDTSSVTAVAFGTGYASASQFSREYKRAFGMAPVHDVRALRQSA